MKSRDKLKLLNLSCYHAHGHQTCLFAEELREASNLEVT